MTTMSHIDKRIDANRAELRSREKIKPLCPESWQRAWDRHPVLADIERDLFQQREALNLQQAALAVSRRTFRR